MCSKSFYLKVAKFTNKQYINYLPLVVMWVPCGIFLERLCLMSGAWHAGNTVIENQSMVKKNIYSYIFISQWPNYYIKILFSHLYIL